MPLNLAPVLNRDLQAEHPFGITPATVSFDLSYGKGPKTQSFEGNVILFPGSEKIQDAGIPLLAKLEFDQQSSNSQQRAHFGELWPSDSESPITMNDAERDHLDDWLAKVYDDVYGGNR